MAEKKRLLIGLMALGLCTASLASCSAFFGASSEYMLSDMTQTSDEDGNIVITFYFTDSSMEPMVVTIPAGLAGEDGVSIVDIEYTQDGESGDITLYIYFSDDRDPFTFTIPAAVDGEDGIGITGVTYSIDEESGNTILVFEYSDGTFSDGIVIQKGEDGEDGSKVTAVSSELDEEGNTIVTIYYSDGTSGTFIVYRGNDGEDGTGISYIEYSNNPDDYDESHPIEDYYLLIIHYSDEDEEDGTESSYVYLEREHGTTWYYGSGIPSSSTGRDGDFYLRISNGYVYCKENGSWNFIFSIYGSGTTESGDTELAIYTIAFNPNGGSFVDPDELGVAYALDGKTIDLESFPEVERTTDQYSIFAGWYKSASYDVNAGQFTDLSIVTSNLNLYARWVDKDGNVAPAEEEDETGGDAGEDDEDENDEGTGTGE